MMIFNHQDTNNLAEMLLCASAVRNNHQVTKSPSLGHKLAEILLCISPRLCASAVRNNHQVTKSLRKESAFKSCLLQAVQAYETALNPWCLRAFVVQKGGIR